MSEYPPSQLSVTRDRAAAFRLTRHHLARRAPSKALASVARDMGGAQAQLLSAAQMSLWCRVRDLQAGDIEEALRQRSLVKASCMRRTLFLVPSADLAVFVRGTARRAEKEVRWTLGKGVPVGVVEAAIDAALGALDQPRTRPEIAELASRALGVRMEQVRGGGWGSRRPLAGVPVGHLVFPVVDLLHLAAARGVVCYGPSRGSEPTFIRADAWIPGWLDMTREEAEARLLRIYLGAFGPAAAEDFALWSGMTLTEARQIWEGEKASLATVDVEGRAAQVLRADLDELARATVESPLVRLLPYFDSFLLGHRQRDHLVAAQHHARVYRPQGWIAPVVLANGRVVAVWEHARDRDQLRIEVVKLGSVPRRILVGLRDEARELGRFLGAKSVDIRVR